MTPEPVLESLPRKGDLRRDVTARRVVCVCECGREFDTTGTAWSHARSARHAVECSYAVVFSFVPKERGWA